MNRRIAEIAARLKRKGIDITGVRHRGSGHIGLQIADASGRRAFLIVGSSPSCHRAALNAVANAKRALSRQAVIA